MSNTSSKFVIFHDFLSAATILRAALIVGLAVLVPVSTLDTDSIKASVMATIRAIIHMIEDAIRQLT